MDIYKWTAASERLIYKDKKHVKDGFQEGGLLYLFLGVYNSQ